MNSSINSSTLQFPPCENVVFVANPTNIFLYSKTFDFTRFCGPPAGLWQLPQVYHPTSRGKDGEELWWHRRCAGIPAVECGWCENVAKRGALVLWSLHEKKGGPSVLELFFFWSGITVDVYVYTCIYIYVLYNNINVYYTNVNTYPVYFVVY